MKDGMTSLLQAIRANDIKEVGAITGGAPDLLSERLMFGRTVLFYCIEKDRLACMQYLVDKGAELAVRDDADNTLLHAAADEGRRDIAAFLLERGLPADARNEDGKTALHLAGDEDVIRLLVAGGSRVNAKDDEGCTPLHECSTYSPAGVRSLIELGADINSKDSEGLTPLHFAALQDCVTSARVLLEKGAKADVRSNRGTAPMDIAGANRNKEMIELLRQK